jgi:predicted amidohydrolase
MRIAIVQEGPEFNQLEASVEKARYLIHKASNEQADLIVFGECWLSGYPVWLDICRDVGIWDSEDIKAVWAEMYRNSLSLVSEHFQKIKKSVHQVKSLGALGLNEVVPQGAGNGTIYNSLVIISKDGELVHHHRKLMPTHTERLVHGAGDSRGLKVLSTPHGRIGGLICWEHWMPLTRQAMHNAGEDIHIALWPMVKEMNHIASRHYAFEGRCHVIAAGQVMPRSQVPSQLEIAPQFAKQKYVLRGGSAVYGPTGQVLLEPVYDKSEILYCEIDPFANVGERMNLDVSGHYQRPDVFRFEVISPE